MTEMWNNIGSQGQLIIMAFGGFMVVYMIIMVLYMKKWKGNAQKWLAENPTAAKVYIISKSGMVRTNGLVINSVDGNSPILFNEGIKVGIYLLPGTHLIESTFTTTRPGILYRNVSTTYGPTKQEIEVEANKTYGLSFDLKTESYEFEELKEN